MNTRRLPNSIQLELVWGCNRRCWFCGIHDIPHNLEFMDLNLVREFARQLALWKPKVRLEFGTGGEPTLHPEFFPIVSMLKETSPKTQIMVQTNCEPWMGHPSEWITQFFNSGGNILVLNCYKEGLKGELERILPALPFPWVDFYFNNPSHLSMYHYALPHRRQFIYLCDDLGRMTLLSQTKKVPQRWLNNQGGSIPRAAYKRAGITPPTLPLQKRCTRVFRELVLSWNGKVPLCCYDWLDRTLAGKFPEQSLEEIWNGRAFQVARELLYSGNRNFSPCSQCDYNGGFRIGLGVWQENLGKSSAELLEEIRLFQAEPPSLTYGFIPLSLRSGSSEEPSVTIHPTNP